MVKKTLIEYSKTMEHENFAKKTRQMGGLNSLTPQWKGGGRGRKGKDAHKGKKGNEKGKDIICHKCHKYGHFASECTV